MSFGKTVKTIMIVASIIATLLVSFEGNPTFVHEVAGQQYVASTHYVGGESNIGEIPRQAAAKGLQPYAVPKGETEIGPKVVNYTYRSAPIPEAEELEGLQVPVPRDCRILNTKGNCVWCSLELLARYAEYKELYNITKNVRDGGDPRCQGGSSPSPVRRFLEAEKIKYEMITNGDRSFLEKYCKVQRRGVAFDIPGHMLNLVHYDPETKIIKVIDNADRSLSVQTWSWEKFHRLWGGWAYVIFREPDLIPYKYNPWRSIPIMGIKEEISREYLPVP